MRKHATRVLLLVVGATLAATPPAPAKPGGKPHPEVHLSNKEFKKLDRFEGHVLGKADKAYREGKFRQAAAEYESFLREYPRSFVIPYVLLRKARCLHRDDKRHLAIQQYNEVVDYFPNVVAYAAPALFYQGLAHWENGDEDKAMKPWARMARDKQYRKHRLAAGAINKLADNLVAKGRVEGAMAHFWQIAVDFRNTNKDEADYARRKLLRYYVRTSPNESRLRTFYQETHLRDRQRMTDEQILESYDYWNRLRHYVSEYGRFKKSERDHKVRCYTYWARRLDGKFPEVDSYRIAVANFHLAADGRTDEWIRRIDEQFSRGKTKDNDRIIRWMELFRAYRQKVLPYRDRLDFAKMTIAQVGSVVKILQRAVDGATAKEAFLKYYNNLDFAKMTNAQIVSLMKVLYDVVADAKMARNTFLKLHMAKLSDDDKVALARYLWGRDFGLARDLCMSMQNKDRGKHELLLYYHGRRDAEHGIPLADHLINVPDYAASALWKKADLLEWHKKYPQAILVLRRITEQPANLWRIAGCYEKMGQVEKAVAQLREVEGFFVKHRVRAAIRIAYVYKRAKLKDKCVASFRRVLTKYPDTRESSEAHNQLEDMGIRRIKGGVGDGKEDARP